MGSAHATWLLEGKVRRAELRAVCDGDPARLGRFAVKHFTSSAEMIRSGEVDAVVIATPHFLHTQVGIDALQNGLHVMVEKPLSVHKADAERLLAARQSPEQVVGVMFNQRTDPHLKRLNQLIKQGELGEIRRVQLTATHWFRSEAYYASAAWRGTWAGEGGGVLLNQCPHQFDAFIWLFGMPRRVRGFCKFGKHHNIEVEDEVTAFLEFDNGVTAVIITSTGETPGTNRLEIAADRGRVVVENEKISFTRTESPIREFSRTSTSGFEAPGVWNAEIPAEGKGGQHVEIMQNFVDSILDGVPLMVPAEDGIKSVELANAILFSALEDRTIELPLDSAAYEHKLNELMASSCYHKDVQTAVGPAEDFAKSFNR